jgi:hypothetical protein
MEQWNRLKIYVVLCVSGIMLPGLTACRPTTTVLPTIVPAAEIVGVTVTAVTPTPVHTPLPGTFTPPPNVTVVEGIWEARPFSTPLDPSITPTIPTRTPRPTAVPPPTRTPFPTFTPIVTITSPPSNQPPPVYINPYRGFTDSKLSIHVVQNNDPGIMDFVRNAQPRILKSVGDLGFMTDVKKASPHTITVGRVDDVFIQNYIGNPEEAARFYVEKHLETYRLNPGVDYWEGWNEPDPGLDRMRWYARFEQERVKMMAQNGFRSAIGGFSPGVPEMDEFALFVPAVQTAILYGGILTLHEGDFTTGDIRNLYGSALPGYPFYADRGAMSLRYRWYYREFLEPMGLVIPLVISELEFAGWSKVDETDLINNQFAWYDAETQKDEYVLGFAIFTAGPCCQWHAFDLNPVLPKLTNYVNSQD